MYLFPFVFIQVCGALERMDPTLEESARISGRGALHHHAQDHHPARAAEHPLGRAADHALLHGALRHGRGAGHRDRDLQHPDPDLREDPPERGQLRVDPHRDGARDHPGRHGRAHHVRPEPDPQPRALPDHRRQELPAARDQAARPARPDPVPVHRLHRLHHPPARGHDLPGGHPEDLRPAVHRREHDAAQLHVHPLRLEADARRHLEQPEPRARGRADHDVRRGDDLLRHREDEGAGQGHPRVPGHAALLGAGVGHRARA